MRLSIRALLSGLLLLSLGLGVGAAQPNLHELRRRAEGGEVQAQYLLGFAYEKGRGTKADEAEAVRWYRKAAEAGNVKAQTNLGARYATGRGVEKSAKAAEGWWAKAAAKGDPDAQLGLALLYYAGDGVPKDGAKAYVWAAMAEQKLSGAAKKKAGEVVHSVEPTLSVRERRAAERRIRAALPRPQVSP